MEVLFQINGSNKELIVSKDNVVFLIEELGKLKVDGVLAYFSCVKGEGSSFGQECVHTTEVVR